MKFKVKLTLWSLAVAGIGLLAGVLMISAQDARTADTKPESTAALEKKALDESDPSNLASKIRWFKKSSSAEESVDKGNMIVAIRKVNLIFDDVDEKKATFKNRKTIVEIEVYSKVQIPVTDAVQFAVIGEKIISDPPRSADGHTFFIHLTPEEFAALKDDAIVTYSIGLTSAPGASEKNAKTKIGAKFGKIDKKLIDRFPVIEEDNQAQMLRMSQTKN